MDQNKLIAQIEFERFQHETQMLREQRKDINEEIGRQEVDMLNNFQDDERRQPQRGTTKIIQVNKNQLLDFHRDE